jgi:hypothetical protein
MLFLFQGHYVRYIEVSITFCYVNSCRQMLSSIPISSLNLFLVVLVFFEELRGASTMLSYDLSLIS